MNDWYDIKIQEGVNSNFDMQDNYYDVKMSSSGALQLQQPIFGFGLFKDALSAISGLAGGASLKEPVKNPDGKNFFDAPGVSIDNKKIARMGDICKGKKAILVVNVASK